MPALVGVVKDGPDPPWEPEHLRVVVTVERKVIVVVAPVLEGPHPSIVVESHSRKRDEVHGLCFCRDLAGFRRLEKNHLQEAGRKGEGEGGGRREGREGREGGRVGGEGERGEGRRRRREGQGGGEGKEETTQEKYGCNDLPNTTTTHCGEGTTIGRGFPSG